jgi:putative ABC transport system ATP-binding protein
MKREIISLHDVCKTYHTDFVETSALVGINLQINEGDFVSVSGPSGCGKSTLLSVLGLLDKQSSGVYKIDGEDTSNISLDEASRIRCEKIGFVFQSFNLINELSVAENVELPTKYMRKGDRKEAKKRVRECLDLVEMAHRQDHYPTQLSGGQQQRVAIARALVNSPSVLLVDEATGNLDSQTGDKIMELIETLNSQGTTVCMVTHDPRYIGLARTRYQLLDGKLAQVVG